MAPAFFIVGSGEYEGKTDVLPPLPSLTLYQHNLVLIAQYRISLWEIHSTDLKFSGDHQSLEATCFRVNILLVRRYLRILH